MMRLVLLVARREYLTVLRSKGFLFATFGVPLMALLLVTVVFGAIDGGGSASYTPPGDTGYVDLAGVISQPEPFRPFEADSLARAAWEEGQLDSWFLIPADYLDSGSVTLYTRLADSEALEDSMAAFLRENLALQADSRLPPARLAQPVELRVRASGMDLGASDAGGVFMVQFLYALAFFVAMQTTSGYLIASLVEEKGSRVLEILITSISPWQLMLGKILGPACIGLTQLAVWLAAALAARAPGPDLPVNVAFELPPDILLITCVYFLLSYFLNATIFVSIGSISDSEQESRQLAGGLTLVTVVPFIAYAVLLGDPHGTVSVALTLFPLTAPLTAIIRMGMAALPAWQLALSLTLLALSLVAAVPLAARLFRWSTLLYGVRPTPRRLWRLLRHPAQGGRGA
ncbi:MAG: ABC transporter permease [Anaerolineaceae bacterium]|nr:ABC transporter permease [Anaerolineaceae bacterium]MDE0329233.1 ABC transporter permease [Anaerolineaceae bacterium]